MRYILLFKDKYELHYCIGSSPWFISSGGPTCYWSCAVSVVLDHSIGKSSSNCGQWKTRFYMPSRDQQCTYTRVPLQILCWDGVFYPPIFFGTNHSWCTVCLVECSKFLQFKKCPKNKKKCHLQWEGTSLSWILGEVSSSCMLWSCSHCCFIGPLLLHSENVLFRGQLQLHSKECLSGDCCYM